MKLYCLLVALIVGIPNGSVAVAAEGEPKPVVLFDGKDTTGWHQAGPGKFDIKDGALTGHGGMGLYWNEKEFGDFILELDWKTTDKGANSGIFVRFPDPKNDPWVAVKQGHEIQICDTEAHYQTGAIYSFKNPTEIASKPVGEWNHYKIKVVGQHYTIELNGKVVNEFDSPDRPVKGRIGLQNHPPTDPPNVYFKDVKVTELPAKAQAASTRAALEPVNEKGKLEPGLVGQYFKGVAALDAVPANAAPFLVKIDKNINFKSAEGQFNKTKLTNDFQARWTGFLKVEKAGPHTFMLRSDDHSKLYLNDQVVVDNGAWEVQKDHEATVELKPGVYALKVDFQNGPGQSQCQLHWKQPGDSKAKSFKDGSLLHAKGAETAIKWDKKGWDEIKFARKDSGAPYDKMDYGPFVQATIKVDENNVTNKGIAIKVGKDHAGTVCFDTELLRYAGGWTGGFLDNHGVAFDGAHGVNPGPDGDVVFQSPAIVGFAAGIEPKSDPRGKPYGPLPREWGRYKGLYLNGDRTVVSYTVGDREILETPTLVMAGESGVFLRTIHVEASDKPTLLLVANEDAAVAVLLSPGLEQKAANGARWAIIPANSKAMTHRIAVFPQAAERFAKKLVAQDEVDKAPDLTKLTQGGPARWTKPVETKGELGKDDAAYTVDTLTAPEENPYHSWLRFGGLDFFSDGRAAVSTWSGDVWIVSGIDDKLEHLKWKRFATGLFQPLGLRIVNDQIYVLGRDRITRFTDSNKDGEADFYENFNSDCQVTPSFHEFAFDLQTDSAGNFYFAKAGPVRPGGQGWEIRSDHNGCVLKVSKDGLKFEVFATGVRAPNGMGIGPGDVITVGDNEGTWTPACRLSIVHKGSFLGVVDLSKKDPVPTAYDPPICFLPHGDVDNSSGGQVWVTSDKWGPFTNRLLHMSYGTCSLFLVSYEMLDGVPQGGVIRFPLQFAAGICRARIGPKDQQVYVAGLRGWQTTAVKDAALQRVRYTGKAVKMPSTFSIKPKGVEITFTTPLDSVSAVDANNYSVEQWNLHWSGDYGSAEYSLADPKEKAHDPVEVTKAELSADQKTVLLTLEDVKPVMQMKIQMKVKTADGTAMDYSIYNTINKVPGKSETAANEKKPATTQAAAVR